LLGDALGDGECDGEGEGLGLCTALEPALLAVLRFGVVIGAEPTLAK